MDPIVPSVSDGTAGFCEGSKLRPMALGHVDDVLGASELLRLGRRDVQRVLQRVAHEDRARAAWWSASGTV